MKRGVVEPSRKTDVDVAIGQFDNYKIVNRH